jgi:hypothetical protein
MVHSLGGRAAGLRLERMKASPRYVDGAFRNTAEVAPGLKKGSFGPTGVEEPPSLPPEAEGVPWPMD